jgi:hypothetical protein
MTIERLPAALAILVAPRDTMRRLLDASQTRPAYLVLLLAMISIALKDVDGGDVWTMKASPISSWWIVIGVLVAAFVCGVALFHLLALAALYIGRALEGESTYRRVLIAFAWGLAPSAWALVVRVPLVIQRLMHVGPPRSAAQVLDPQLISQGCSAALLVGLFQLLLIVWTTIVTSATLAEAFRFSVWRGFGTFALTMVSPLVVILAGVLAFH